MPTRGKRRESSDPANPDPHHYDSDPRPLIRPRRSKQSSIDPDGWPSWHQKATDTQRYMAAYYAARVAGGVCTACGQTGVVPGRTRCAVCQTKERDAANRRARARRAAGVCAGCGAADPRGRYCPNCLEVDRARTQRRRRRQTSESRLRQRRVDAGLCPRCEAPAATGRKMCAGCLTDKRLARAALVASWSAAGRCSKCGDPRDRPEVRRCDHCRAQGERYRLKYLAQGFCACGGFRVRERVSCAVCLRKHREHQQRRRTAAKSAGRDESVL